MDVSVILVSYNTKDLTKDCLKSVYEKTSGIDFEVFVVDNNSSDGSVEMIESEFPQVKLIKNLDNKGFGSANNIAIKQSRAKYIFCLNTDTVLIDNAIKRFFDFMEKEENKKTGACGCQLLNADMTNQHSYGCFPKISRIVSTLFGINFIFPAWYKKTYLKSKYENNETPYSVDYITGADLFMRKSVLDEIGVYDERFFMYFEESELQLRMNKAGYKSVIIPEINIIHYCGLPSKNVPLKKMKMFRESELKYFEKRSGKFAKLFVKSIYIIRSLFTINPINEYFERIKVISGL